MVILSHYLGRTLIFKVMGAIVAISIRLQKVILDKI